MLIKSLKRKNILGFGNETTALALGLEVRAARESFETGIPCSIRCSRPERSSSRILIKKSQRGKEREDGSPLRLTKEKVSTVISFFLLK